MKKFIYFISVIWIVIVPISNAMREQEVKKIKFGERLVCFVEENNTNFSSYMQNDSLSGDGIKEEGGRGFNIALSDIKITIDRNKKLKITGNKRKRDILVQNPFGEIIAEFSSKKQKKDDKQSLDEEEIIDDRKLQLLPGSSVTVGSYPSDLDDAAMTKVTFDETVSLISKNKVILPSLLSHWQKSQLVKIATTQPRLPKDKGRVYLDDTIIEITFLDQFLRSGCQEERKKMIMALPIIEHVKILILLEKHGLKKEFDPNCNFFNEARILLKKRVNDSLEEATRMIFLGKPFEVEWFGKIKNLPLKGQEIVEDILRRIVRPVPNVFREWYMPFVNAAQCYLDAMRAIMSYQNGEKAIVDLKDGKVLLSRDNVYWMFLDKTGMKTEIKYENNRLEIVDIGSKRVLLYRENVGFTNLNEDYTRMAIKYLNDEVEIINFKSKKSFPILGKIYFFSLNLSNPEISVYYEDQSAEVINFEEKDPNKRVIYKDNSIKFLEIIKDCSRIIVLHSDGRGKVIDLENGEEVFKENNIKGMYLDLFGKKIIVIKNSQFKIIDLDKKDPNRWVILERNNFSHVHFSPNAKIIYVVHEDKDKLEIMNAKNGRKLFTRYNFKKLKFSLDDTVIVILYKDGGGEIRYFPEKDLNQNSRVLFEGDNIDDIALNSIGTKATVWYKDKWLKMIDLENYNRDTIFIKLTLEELVAIFTLKKLSCLKKNLNLINRYDLEKYRGLWQLLNLSGKKKLIDSYLAREVKNFFGSKKQM